jgi:hypothetical protein
LETFQTVWRLAFGVWRLQYHPTFTQPLPSLNDPTTKLTDQLYQAMLRKVILLNIYPTQFGGKKMNDTANAKDQVPAITRPPIKTTNNEGKKFLNMNQKLTTQTIPRSNPKAPRIFKSCAGSKVMRLL